MAIDLDALRAEQRRNFQQFLAWFVPVTLAAFSIGLAIGRWVAFT